MTHDRRPPLPLLARAYATVVLARIAARLAPRRLEWLLTRRRRLVPFRAEAADVVAAVDHVLGSGWPLVRRGCLVRGISLYELLGASRTPVSLTFGMPSALEAAGHCWIEKAGTPLYERDDPRSRFTTVWTIPPAPV